MKKILLVILTIFLSVITYSQKIQYIGLPDNTVEVRNKLRIDALKDATGDSVMVVDAGGNVKLKAITDFTGIGGGTSGPDSLYLENPIYSVKEVNTNGDTIQVIKFRADSLPELRYAAAMRDTNNWVGSTLVDVDYLNDRIAGLGGGSSGSGVQSVSGLNTDNTDPANPIINISVDGTTITGDGTPGSPLISHASGGGVYTASNGLTMVDSDVQWGGTVTSQILLYSDNYGLNFGNNYWANSGQSFSFGDFTQAANGGFAANRNSHAMGTYSTALNGANAYGDYSLATGGSRTASLGVYGVALGIQTYVNSYASFATGYNDTTNASYSSVLGAGLNAKYSYGTVIGKWNNRSDPVYGDYPNTQHHNLSDKVFQIGIGDSSLNPKNALDVYWSGKMRFTQYGSGVFIPGIYDITAPVHSLQVDANGNVVEGNLISEIGTATLSSGTVTVSSTLVKSTSKIFITVNTPSGTQGFLSIPTRTAGTSFVINSTSATETSTVDWIIVN